MERIADAKADIAALKIGMAETKHDILRWMVGGFIAQTALLLAVISFLK
jgi:hypothetical protein